MRKDYWFIVTTDHGDAASITNYHNFVFAGTIVQFVNSHTAMFMHKPTIVSFTEITEQEYELLSPYYLTIKFQ